MTIEETGQLAGEDGAKTIEELITAERFSTITNEIVIPVFESGYYHPDMMKHYSPADQKILADSGETMFGLDRKAGIQLKNFDGWKDFWAMIDTSDARHKWKHYYMGGELNKPLKELASKVMYKWFLILAGRYLKPDSLSKVAADDRLVIHFAYGCWNGEGWFERFARALNKATGTKNEILDQAMKARTMASAKAIRQGGIKMYQLFNNDV